MSKATLGLGGYFSNPIDDPINIIRHAWQLGIRYFDTAPAYGLSEEYFGLALDHPEILRYSYILSTKTKATNATEVDNDFENSLRKLLTFYIDIYFGHDFINDVKTWDESQKALAEMVYLKRTGFVSKIGVSGHSLEAARLAIDSKIIDYIMVPHSISHRVFDEVIAYAASKGVGVITMKNFGSGILLGGPEGNNPFTEDIKLSDIVSFSTYHPGTEFIIPAARSIRQLNEIFNAYQNATQLTSFEISKLDRLIRMHLGSDFCRFCNLCRPCEVYGWQMSQPGILKSYLYEQSFKLDMKETYNAYKLNATDCNDCDNLCSARCPHGISIKDKMLEAHQYFGGE